MGFMDKVKGAAQQAGQAAQQATQGVGHQAEQRDRAVKLNQSGVNYPATLTSLRETGKSDVGGGKEVEFTVQVKPATGDTYTATFTQFMVASVMEQVHEGSEITVRVDPDDPNSMLFWGMQS
jgi:Protein of unknown function (DUF3592)